MLRVPDGWREARVIASARGADPVDEHLGIIVELIEDRVQERGRDEFGEPEHPVAQTDASPGRARARNGGRHT